MAKVVIDENRCKGCGLCPDVCPRGIIKMSEEINRKGYHPAVITDMEQCIACGFCYEICPDTVIEVYK